tara:strand:+ start:6878 stop:8740 length:1863 start_codon:yes stop_codon:yes gene_type:complete
MIELIGPENCNEYTAALDIKEQLELQWPEIKNSPKSEDHIKIIASAKLPGGYQITDIDIIILANFSRGRRFIPKETLKDSAGNNIEGSPITVDNFVVTIELKEHSPQNIIFNGNNIVVKYDGKKHSATDQNSKQKHSLRTFFDEKYKENIWVSSFVYLSNVPQKNSDFLGLKFCADDFLTCLAVSSRINFYDRKYHLKANQQKEVIKKIFTAALFEESIPTDLDRNNMDRIISSKDETHSIASFMGKKAISLRGRGGSGKTIMYMQAIWKAYQNDGKRVLVLTYNVALAADIRRMFHLLNISSDDQVRCVNVKTIHSHFYKLFNKFKIEDSDINQRDNYESLCQELIEIINKVDIVREIKEDYDYHYDAVVIDEAQDTKSYEIEILKKIYGLKKLCIADGIDQLMRGAKANWFTLEEKKSILPISLSETLRMKRNLSVFIKSYTQESNAPLDIHLNKTAGGGKVFFLENSYINYPSFHNDLMMSLKENNNKKIDTLFCSTNKYAFKNFFESIDQGVYNGFDPLVRREFPRNNDYIRTMHYESIRGLEGWIVVLDEIDQYYEYLIKYKNTRLSENDAKQRMLIALTRPIDTLVISVKDKNSKFSKMLIEICEKHKDFVEFY